MDPRRYNYQNHDTKRYRSLHLLCRCWSVERRVSLNKFLSDNLQRQPYYGPDIIANIAKIRNMSPPNKVTRVVGDRMCCGLISGLIFVYGFVRLPALHAFSGREVILTCPH